MAIPTYSVRAAFGDYSVNGPGVDPAGIYVVLRLDDTERALAAAEAYVNALAADGEQTQSIVLAQACQLIRDRQSQ